MKKKQQSKKLSKEDIHIKIQEWHITLKERLIRTRIEDDYDEKWDKSPPEC